MEPDYGDEEDPEEEKKVAPTKSKVSTNNATVKKVLEEEVKIEKKPGVPRAPWRQKKEEKEKEKADALKAANPAKKKVNKILGSMPQNWEEEEKKFFDSNFQYDPQFTYDSPATNKRFLKMFPAPKYEYLP